MKGIVLITGANRGLGLGFVRYYLNRDWKVFACVRHIEKSLELKSLIKIYPENLAIEALDVSKVTSIDTFINKLSSFNNKLNLVINNAGICFEENLGDYTPKVFLDTYQTNSLGVVLFSQAIIPFIKRKGRLVNISSGLGSISLNINPDLAFDAYAMSKAALNIFTKRLSTKLAAQEIITIALSPGWVQTDMGGIEAPLTVTQAIKKMANVIENLSTSDSGTFLSEDGEILPW